MTMQNLLKPASNFIMLIVPRRYFCCCPYCFCVCVCVCVCVYVCCIFVLFAPYARFFFILVRFGYLSGHILGNSCSLGLRYVFLV